MSSRCERAGNNGLRCRERTTHRRQYENEWQDPFHGLMVMTNVAVAVPLELVALMVTEYVPAEPGAGVPEITPVVVFTLRPAGSPVAL